MGLQHQRADPRTLGRERRGSPGSKTGAAGLRVLAECSPSTRLAARMTTGSARSCAGPKTRPVHRSREPRALPPGAGLDASRRRPFLARRSSEPWVSLVRASMSSRDGLAGSRASMMKTKSTRKVTVGTVNKSTDARSWTLLARKVRHVREGDVRWRTMYLGAVPARC